MRAVFSERLEAARFRDGLYASAPGEQFGAFELWGPCSAMLRIIASNGEDLKERWEHVSISLANRTPNWKEMSFVKDLFWDEEECVVQFHPPRSCYVNYHPTCLHLWKPPFEVRLPPTILLGPKERC
jgi:hypothetical protein